MNTLQTFNFENQEVRTQVIDDKAWFIGKDVAEALGYKNTRDALKNHVEDDEKAEVAIHDGRQNRKMTVIDESGVYSLFFGSQLDSSKRFKKWIKTEVLPAIRKHGAYMTAETIEKALMDPDTLIQLATTLKDERTKRLVAEQRVNELQPKADYYDSILKNKSLTTITVIAKNYGMSGNALNNQLHKLGVQYKQSGTWLLYSKYQDKGYTHTEMIPVQGSDNLKPSTKWTQKGHIFIYQLLKENGTLPLIEQKDK